MLSAASNNQNQGGGLLYQIPLVGGLAKSGKDMVQSIPIIGDISRMGEQLTKSIPIVGDLFSAIA